MGEALLRFIREHRGLPFRTVTVFNYLLEAALLGGVLILLLLAARRLLRGRLGNGAVYAAWLLVALRLLAPLALPNPVMNELRPAVSTDAAARPVADQVRIRFGNAARELVRSIAPESTGVYENDGHDEAVNAANLVYNLGEYTAYGWTGKWLLLLYGAGALATAGGMVWQNVRFRRRLRQSLLDAPEEAVLAAYRRDGEALGLKRLPAVRLADPLPSACLVGFFRPLIAASAALTGEELRLALRHELGHYRARDNRWSLLRNICCCAQWFNPLAWVAARASRQDGELACDERVTRGMTDTERRAYAQTLLHAAARRTSPGLTVCATGLTARGKRLKARITGILRSRTVRRGAVIGFAAAAMLIGGLAFFTAEVKEPAVTGATLGFADIESLRVAQQPEPYALLTPSGIEDEDEAVERFLDYLRTGLFSGANYGRWMSRADADFTVMPSGDGWYVLMNVGGNVAQMLLDDQGAMLSYQAPLGNQTQPYRDRLPANLDEAALSYVRQLAVGCLGASEVGEYERIALTAVPGYGVMLTGTACLDGARYAFDLEMSACLFRRFERVDGAEAAAQDPLTAWQRLQAWLREELSWSDGETCAPLVQVIWDEETQRLQGVISLRAALCSGEVRRALVNRWGEAERHTLLLTFDPQGQGFEDVRLSAWGPDDPAKGLSEGVLTESCTVYDLVEGRWFSMAGLLPEGTPYALLAEATPRELGVAPVMGADRPMLLVRYARADGAEDTGWILSSEAPEVVASQPVIEAETLILTVGGAAIEAQAYDRRQRGDPFDAFDDANLLPEEAAALALEAGMAGYGLTLDELLARPFSYGFKLKDPYWEQERYWQLDFDLGAGLCEVYVQDSDGAIVRIFGPDEGNG